jgi:iron-sulfur cluster assembly 2
MSVTAAGRVLIRGLVRPNVVQTAAGLQHNIRIRSWRRSMVLVTQTRVDDSPFSSSPIVTSSSSISISDDASLPSSSLVSDDTNKNGQRLFVTDSCWRRIQQLVEQKKAGLTNDSSVKNYYLRVFVDAGGCSGFSYKFEIGSDDDLGPDDVVFRSEGARVIVDEGSLELLEGSKVDYVEEMIKSGFEVRENPKSESACGCGSSFAIKNFSTNPALD